MLQQSVDLLLIGTAHDLVLNVLFLILEYGIVVYDQVGKWIDTELLALVESLLVQCHDFMRAERSLRLDIVRCINRLLQLLQIRVSCDCTQIEVLIDELRVAICHPLDEPFEVKVAIEKLFVLIEQVIQADLDIIGEVLLDEHLLVHEVEDHIRE